MHRHDGNVAECFFRIVNNNDAVGIKQAGTFNARSAREHQSVVGVELGQLTDANFHAQHHALAQRLIHIDADKGQPCVAAHVARALEGKIAVWTVTEVERDTLRTKQ